MKKPARVYWWAFFVYIYFKNNIMSKEIKNYTQKFNDELMASREKIDQESAILSGMPLYAGPEFNVREHMEKEDKARGLGDYAKEKREHDYEKEKAEIVGMFDGLRKASESAARKADRLEAVKLAVQAGYADLVDIQAAAEAIYQFINKPE